MSTVSLRGLAFAYPGGPLLFEDLNLTLDTAWRLALVGANGRGKTTLLRLLAGELEATGGSLTLSVAPRLFPRPVRGDVTAFDAAIDAAGEFRRLEQDMAACAEAGTETALERYGTLQLQYQEAGGYDVGARVSTELTALDVPERLWRKPLDELSGGERTRCLLAGAFCRKDGWPLIDEPTNHLDAQGRALVAAYLSRQRGFVLVSHDRAFLDACADHVLALNADSVALRRTRFSVWRQEHLVRLDAAAARNRSLRREIDAFEANARMRRAGAGKREAEKAAHTDKGFIGARAARQMKRALAAEARAQRAAEERRATLMDVEKRYEVRFPESSASQARVLLASNFVVRRDEPLFEPVSFELHPGERLVIAGGNGAGKSSLLAVAAGASLATEGTLARAPQLRISQVRQEPLWQQGLLRDRLRGARLDQTHFRQIMAALGVRGEVLDTPIERLSPGQRKKIELARSLATPAQLYVWDEPLNFVDMETREALETAILRDQPTMLLVEHDQAFVGRVATGVLSLSRRS